MFARDNVIDYQNYTPPVKKFTGNSWLHRKNKPEGICYGGRLYQSVPEWGDEYIAVLEASDTYLIVSRYDRGTWRATPIGEKKKVMQIGMGRPTMWRINNLKAAVNKPIARVLKPRGQASIYDC